MKQMRITPIPNGTVIDHIMSGGALKVLKVLGITGEQDSIVSVLMSVTSNVHGRKDVVKIENRELQPNEVNKIAIIAPDATINIIRDSTVVDKVQLKLPEKVEGVLKCSNPLCISNKERDVPSKSLILSREPIRYKCYYCEREIEDLHKSIII